MAEKFPTPQERAMAWLLEAKEEYLVDSAIEMLYPTVTFNSYEAAVKHIHETPGTWRITKIYRTLPVGEEVTEADDEC